MGIAIFCVNSISYSESDISLYSHFQASIIYFRFSEKTAVKVVPKVLLAALKTHNYY